MIPIPGFSRYTINKYGQVYSQYRSRLKEFTPDKDGYPTVSLKGDDGIVKTKKVHRLLAEIFIPNPDNKPFVNHKNGKKNDHRLDNLEWVTSSENLMHALNTGLNPKGFGTGRPNAKLDNDKVKRIIEMRESGMAYSDISRAMSIGYTITRDICLGKRWRRAQ